MFRKIILSTIALAAMTLSVLAPAASAQTSEPVCTLPYNRCLLDYPGGFTLPVTPTPVPTSSTVASADNVAATGNGDNGAIAFTGSESTVLGYTGAGLIGVGALALVAARRKTGSDTELN